MNSFRRHLLLVLGIILGAFFVAVSAPAQHVGVTAELTLNQANYLPGEDLIAKVRIVNRSGQTLTLGDTDDWLAISIQGESKMPVSKTGDLHLGGAFTLGTGMMANREFNPAPVFDLRQPGAYTLNASVRIPKWNVSINCKPALFTVIQGLPLPGLAALDFGMPVPPGVTNAFPEIRHYSLIKVAYQDNMRLYFRLTDSNGRVLRCAPAGPFLSFSTPEAQIDRFSNLHVLWQTGAREFTYLVYMPNGDLLVHETHSYTETRPTLKTNDRGNIAVVGGVRLYEPSDIPNSAGVTSNSR